MKHPYADILIAIAEGKEIQWTNGTGVWTTSRNDAVLDAITRASWPPERYRIKPATITINSCEVEAPVPTSDWPITVVNGSVSTLYAKVYFATKEARDAAYAALIKPFESDK